MASCSSGLERDVQKLGRGFTVFQTFRDHTKRQGLDARHGFITVGAITHDAGEIGHFGEPPAVSFSLELDGEDHARTVASGPSGEQAAPDELRGAEGMEASVPRAAAERRARACSQLRFM